MMPHVSGRELLAAVRADEALRSIPVILLTARAGMDARIESLDAGADDYLAKPFDEGELLARIRSLLRIKEYQDTIRAQAAELAQWNRTLSERVEQQVDEIERIGRLRRFLSPQVAEAIVTVGDESALESHRREITVTFCDLRGFTRFSEVVEPEEVMRVLHEYHAAMGAVIFEHEGTLEHFEGDGMMIFFNDPIPVPDPAERAVRMAVAMRDRAAELSEGWRKRGYELDFGVGIAIGYATLGRIGFEGRFDYGAVGSVVNLASRLGNEAAGGQILISQRVLAAVEELVEVEPVGEIELKGFHETQRVSNVVRLKQASRVV
jgi:class 3 adenylate cyclase